MIELKCVRCGWGHAGVTKAQAQSWADEANRDSAASGESPAASLVVYQRCFRCQASAQDFVLACREDAPAGCTIQPAIVPVHNQWSARGDPHGT